MGFLRYSEEVASAVARLQLLSNGCMFEEEEDISMLLDLFVCIFVILYDNNGK